jgi:hypothetical protein
LLDAQPRPFDRRPGPTSTGSGAPSPTRTGATPASSTPASGKTYTYYRADNALWTASSPFTSMTYDPLQRLSQTSTSGAVPLSYQQDGLDTVGLWQIDPVYGPGLLFRYVPGADIDQPVADIMCRRTGVSSSTPTNGEA